MQRTMRGRAALAAITAVLAHGGGACSDDDEDARGGSRPSEGASALTARLSEDVIELSSGTVAAGTVTITAENVGTMEHELLVVRSDAPLDGLDVVDERVPEDAIDMVDEISEFEAGSTETKYFDLTAGRYLLICNLPGHYAAGMRAELIVT